MRHKMAVVMGVGGSGKTVVGTALARRLQLPFRDADPFHPQANIDKMAAGVPLDDSDRAPWLASIGGWLAEHRHEGAVVTCSALKRAYRDALRAAVGELPFLHLDGTPDVVTERVANRPGHFLPASLVRSQFETLEPLQQDELGLKLDFTRPVEDLVEEFAEFLTRLGC